MVYNTADAYLFVYLNFAIILIEVTRMIKLICIDMDGTLYNKKKEIYESTKQALALAYSQGIQIAIVSGRPINYIMAYAKEIGIDIIMTGSNGATIKVQDHFIKHALDQKDLLQILRICEKNKMHIFMKGLNCIYTNMKESNFFQYDELTKELPVEFQMHKSYVPSLVDVIQNSPIPVYKLIVLADCQESVIACRKQIHDAVQVSTFSQDPHHFELSSYEATKGKAITQLADILHLNTEEIACIGDGDNDIPMFEVCGYRIAMGNASETLKQMSNFVSETCENDGVGVAIHHILENQK